MGLCLPELQSLILCSGQFFPINGMLITFPKTVIVHFEELCNHHWSYSSSESLPKRLSGVKEIVCRPPSFSSPPGMSLFTRIDWMLKKKAL